MGRRTALQLIAPALFLFLIFVFLWRNNRASVAGGKNALPTAPTAEESRAPAPQSGEKSKAPPAPSATQAKLAIRVLSSGRPVAGASVFCNLFSGRLDRPEGVSPVMRKSGRILGFPKGYGFIGDRTTDPRGAVSFDLLIPGDPKFLDSHIRIMVQGERIVRKEGIYYDLPVPHAGETKAVTMSVELGAIVSGKIEGVEADDMGGLWAYLEETKAGGAPRPPPPNRPPGGRPAGEADEWGALVTINPDGTFRSRAVPLAPLTISVVHLQRKYEPYEQAIFPPFDTPITVVLRRDPAYTEGAKAVLTITNPPSGEGFGHRFVLFNEDTKDVKEAGDEVQTGPKTIELLPGSYQVFLISSDFDTRLYAQSSFVAVRGAAVDVPLTLQPTGEASLRIRERDTGSPPRLKTPFIDFAYKISGKYYRLFRVARVGLDASVAKGEKVVLQNLIPGSVRLKVGDLGSESYGEWSMEFPVGPGEVHDLDVFLEKNPAAERKR